MTLVAFWKMRKLKPYLDKMSENLQGVGPKYLQLKKPDRGSVVQPSLKITALPGRRRPESIPWTSQEALWSNGGAGLFCG